MTDDTTILSRPRRLRSTAALRNMVAETSLSANDFVAPFFVVPGQNAVQEIRGLPEVFRYSTDVLLKEIEKTLNLGIRAVMLFAVLPTTSKDEHATSAADPNGLMPETIRAIKKVFAQDVVVFTDVCLCSHTSHGHCGLLRQTNNGPVVDNDASLKQLANMALAQAAAGTDFVAPSDMMDGRVAHIRKTLDAANFTEVGILSYAVKYASAFYGPFREAAGSAPQFGDRSSYQMDSRNVQEALREIALDENEGADMLMVKPALPYLDVIAKVRNQTHLPVAAYNVSGEYAMIKAAVSAGALDEAKAVREILFAIKRAGANFIISYHAIEALKNGWL